MLSLAASPIRDQQNREFFEQVTDTVERAPLDGSTIEEELDGGIRTVVGHTLDFLAPPGNRFSTVRTGEDHLVLDSHVVYLGDARG